MLVISVRIIGRLYIYTIRNEWAREGTKRRIKNERQNGKAGDSSFLSGVYVGGERGGRGSAAKKIKIAQQPNKYVYIVYDDELACLA